MRMRMLPCPAQTRPIDPFVIGPKLSGLDLFPPRGVLPVPVPRGLQGRGQGMLPRPPQLPDLVAVQGIAAVMARAVGDMPDQRQRLSKQLEDRLGHLLVGSLVAGAKVVYLSRLALLEHERNALAVVLHIDPIALLKPIAVERQWLILQGVRHEERDELLRVLVGA